MDSVIIKFVITRAPPDLPLPLDVIAIRILKQFLPIGVPIAGFFSKSSNKTAKSAFSE